MEDDEGELYEGVRAHFPATFGKQSKPVTPLESLHNATRRPSSAVKTDQSAPDDTKGFPSLSSSSKSWLDSPKNSNPSSRNRSNPNPSPKPEPDSDVVIGPPRPLLNSASYEVEDDDDDDDEDGMIGPPQPPAIMEEEDGEMIGPPRPPPGDSDVEEDSDGEGEGRFRIPLSNEIVLKGHTKVN